MSVPRAGDSGHNHATCTATGWQRVAALGIVAVLVIAVVIVTESTDAVAAVVTPMLLVLGWTSTGRIGRSAR
jgi:hypothetical protein